MPIEFVGGHQRVLVNPIVSILCVLAGVALIQFALRTRFLVLFAAGLLVMALGFFLIQYHCLDCGGSGWYQYASRHACEPVLARWREKVETHTLLRARTQLSIWIYVLVFGILIYLVARFSRL
jgi:hypothetical protein